MIHACNMTSLRWYTAPTVTIGITLKTIFPPGGNALVAPSYGLATTGRSHSFESESLNNHNRNCVQHGYYNAAVQMVARASFQDKTQQGMGIDTPATWVIAFLTIARIVLITTEEVHILLSSILMFFNSILYCVLGPLNIYPAMPLPLSIGDFQSMITNATNTNLLKSILPVPHYEYISETEHIPFVRRLSLFR
jgi:hypothetical protein